MRRRKIFEFRFLGQFFGFVESKSEINHLEFFKFSKNLKLFFLDLNRHEFHGFRIIVGFARV